VGAAAQVEPKHIMVCHHYQHFAWLKPQAFPSKSFNVFSQRFRDRPTGLFLLSSQIKLVWEAFL